MNSSTVLAGLILFILTFSLVAGAHKSEAYSTAQNHPTITFTYPNSNETYATDFQVDITITNPEDNSTYSGNLPLKFETNWGADHPLWLYLPTL